MSAILKSDILGVGDLEQEIFQAINFFGCAQGYTQTTDPCEAQRIFAQRLADAISDGVSRGVQKYLREVVKTINQPTLTNSDGSIPPHVHPNVPLYDLQAP
jgi:hypothetical protein